MSFSRWAAARARKSSTAVFCCSLSSLASASRLDCFSSAGSFSAASSSTLTSHLLLLVRLRLGSAASASASAAASRHTISKTRRQYYPYSALVQQQRGIHAMAASTSTPSRQLRNRAPKQQQQQHTRPHTTQRRPAGDGGSTPSAGHDHHSHSHLPFGLGHSHAHSHTADSEEAAALAAAFSGAGDRGSRIILWGLASNVALTVAKGVGGYMLHSASLLADAGHSLSDLLGDLVVLFSWRLSRRPASRMFQYGYGKFEALGSLLVATLLVGGALGIGVHSYFLFLQALAHAASTNAPELAHAAETVLSNSTSIFGSLGAHSHEHAHALDPNAAWIALLSVVLKEWMYRATLKVAKEEGSNVLEANALHHRSDVFSGCLAGVAILGSSLGFPMLDPVGGLLVAGMIIKQGSEIGLNAAKELVDYVVDPELTTKIEAYVLSLRDGTVIEDDEHNHEHEHEHTHEHVTPQKLPILSVTGVRTFKSGTFTLVDMAIGFPETLTVKEASQTADQVADLVKAKFPVIKEVVVRFDAESQP